MILAPLRGVTIHTFRKVFARPLMEYGFTEAFTPFITANPGLDPLKDRELRASQENLSSQVVVTPQFIGKDPNSLRFCLERIKAAGYKMADLNCGCPYPMVRNKLRGSGLLKTPDVLLKMIDVGCSVMGEGCFSIKTRLGIDCKDELLSLISSINSFPLRFITVHARTARQMYDGQCDMEAFNAIAKVAKVPIVYNGDAFVENGCVRFPSSFDQGVKVIDVMIGRGFVCALSERSDIDELLDNYINESLQELCSERAVLGRMKELLAYWSDFPRWGRIWKVAKMSRNLEEFKLCL